MACVPSDSIPIEEAEARNLLVPKFRICHKAATILGDQGFLALVNIQASKRKLYLSLSVDGEDVELTGNLSSRCTVAQLKDFISRSTDWAHVRILHVRHH